MLYGSGSYLNIFIIPVAFIAVVAVILAFVLPDQRWARGVAGAICATAGIVTGTAAMIYLTADKPDYGGPIAIIAVAMMLGAIPFAPRPRERHGNPQPQVPPGS